MIQVDHILVAEQAKQAHVLLKSHCRNGHLYFTDYVIAVSQRLGRIVTDY